MYKSEAQCPTQITEEQVYSWYNSIYKPSFLFPPPLAVVYPLLRPHLRVLVRWHSFGQRPLFISEKYCIQFNKKEKCFEKWDSLWPGYEEKRERSVLTPLGTLANISSQTKAWNQSLPLAFKKRCSLLYQCCYFFCLPKGWNAVGLRNWWSLE